MDGRRPARAGAQNPAYRPPRPPPPPLTCGCAVRARRCSVPVPSRHAQRRLDGPAADDALFTSGHAAPRLLPPPLGVHIHAQNPGQTAGQTPAAPFKAKSWPKAGHPDAVDPVTRPRQLKRTSNPRLKCTLDCSGSSILKLALYQRTWGKGALMFDPPPRCLPPSRHPSPGRLSAS